MMKYVIFKSLLDDEEPLQHGLLNREIGFVDCLCGCKGCFEPGDYEIIVVKQLIRKRRNRRYNSIIADLVQQKVIHPVYEDKMKAVVEFTQVKTEEEIKRLAEYLDSFDFVPGVRNYSGYGKHLFCREFELDYYELEDMVLPRYIDFKGYGKNKMAGESCGFTSLGFVGCTCIYSEIMNNVRRK